MRAASQTAMWRQSFTGFTVTPAFKKYRGLLCNIILTTVALATDGSVVKATTSEIC